VPSSSAPPLVSSALPSASASLAMTSAPFSVTTVSLQAASSSWLYTPLGSTPLPRSLTAGEITGCSSPRALPSQGSTSWHSCANSSWAGRRFGRPSPCLRKWRSRHRPHPPTTRNPVIYDGILVTSSENVTIGIVSTTIPHFSS
jgi:hypothetical protein